MIEILVEDPKNEDAIFRIRMLLETAAGLTRQPRGKELKLIADLTPPAIAEILLRFSKCAPVLDSCTAAVRHWLPMMNDLNEGVDSPWIEIVRPALVHCMSHKDGLLYCGLETFETCAQTLVRLNIHDAEV